MAKNGGTTIIQTGGGHGAAIAGVVAIGAGGVTVAYAYTLFDKYKANGGTKYAKSFWQWMLAGMPASDGGGGGGTVTVTLDAPTVNNYTAVVNGSATSTGGTISSIVVSWGDSTTATTSSTFPFTHTYSSAGTYPITVTATDSSANTGSSATSVTIGSGTPPTNVLSVSPMTATVGQTLTLTFNVTNVPSGTNVEIGEQPPGAWLGTNIGTTTSFPYGISVTFSSAGTYQFAAVVNPSGIGFNSTNTNTVNIIVSPRAITPTITASASSVPLTGSLSFSGGGCTPGGTVTITSSPYTIASTHTVASDGTWSTGTFAASAVPYVAGTYTFTVTDNTTGISCSTPAVVTFTSATVYGTQAHPWNFGSGYNGPGYYAFVGGVAYYVASQAEYNAYMAGTVPTGKGIFTSGGMSWYYFDGNTQTLSNEGATLQSGVPIYEAWVVAQNGFPGTGYFYWVSFNALSSVPITSMAMFDQYNSTISAATPLTAP
jgi:hypothetical protein